jgi:colicin import membrane protein
VSKATEQNDKLKRAIIVSAVLHVILFAALIWSSFDEHIDASAGGGGGLPLTPSWSIPVR